MSYRGPALTYRIRKTTINNKTGDNFAITVPRIIAQQFENYFFTLEVSGNSIKFESGCKLSIQDIQAEKTKRVFVGAGVVSFT